MLNYIWLGLILCSVIIGGATGTLAEKVIHHDTRACRAQRHSDPPANPAAAPRYNGDPSFQSVHRSPLSVSVPH